MTINKHQPLTMTNDFHDTVANVRAPRIGENRWFLSHRQWDNACSRLCGMSDCECGSIRGPIVNSGGRKFAVEQCETGYELEMVARG